MIKLFEENSYIKKFESQIVNLDKENNLIELEKTAFYGKGGGQPGDTGELITKLETTIKEIEELAENQKELELFLESLKLASDRGIIR